MKNPKCVLYLVNGIDVPLYHVMKHGNIYRGYKTPKRQGIPEIIKSSEVSSVGGQYEEIQPLIRPVFTRHGYPLRS
jgi:hypothetical protein